MVIKSNIITKPYVIDRIKIALNFYLEPTFRVLWLL